MVQIFVIVGKDASLGLLEELEIIKMACYSALKECWRISYEDLSFTSVRALRTHCEADFQIEIRYASGRSFDPSDEEQTKLAVHISNCLSGYSCIWDDPLSPSFSIWIKPFYKSLFIPFDFV